MAQEVYLLFQEVSLYLSPLRRQKSSAPLAVFTIPALSTTWNRLAVQVWCPGTQYLSPGSNISFTWVQYQVEGGSVRLFLNCQAADSTSIGRHQVSQYFWNKFHWDVFFQKVEFDPASSLYIGQVACHTCQTNISNQHIQLWSKF